MYTNLRHCTLGKVKLCVDLCANHVHTQIMHTHKNTLVQTGLQHLWDTSDYVQTLKYEM